MYSILRFPKQTGYSIPTLSALTNNNANLNEAKDTVPSFTLAPAYRFVPQVISSNLNKAAQQPQFDNGVPAVPPTNAYGLPPAAPAHTYEAPPNQS